MIVGFARWRTAITELTWMVDMATGWLCHELYMWHDTGEFGRRIPASGRADARHNYLPKRTASLDRVVARALTF
jgi:hypothetical protein